PGKRIVVLAGMGLPGRFGTPELSVMVRELAWSLARLGKKHLATVLIGTGSGNIAVADAVRAWLRGLGAALAGTDAANEGGLKRSAGVQMDAGGWMQLGRAIKSAEKPLEPHIQGEYEEIGKARMAERVRSVGAKLNAEARAEWEEWQRSARADAVARRHAN